MTRNGPRATPQARPALLVVLTLANVSMQLASALLLKLAPEPASGRFVWIGVLLGGVLALNVMRFVVWGAVHARFPLSVAYPASALFFPGIVAMAWWFGEQVGPAQIAGAALVMTGVVILLSERETGV
jgi:drug/metabolite transporter (DMT)-like permease